jgi:hypothetical protein
MSRVPAVLALALAAALAAAAPLTAQTGGAVILADTVRVGQVVPVAVRVLVEPGDRVLLPDTLPLRDPDLENAARLRQRTDTLVDGRVQVTGIYAVTAWRPGPADLPDLGIQVVGADGSDWAMTVPLPVVEVRSVLPVDAEALDPMPAKGVLGPSFPWWLLPALVLVALAALAAAWWWLGRRRPARAVTPAVVLAPRPRALAELEEARAAGHVERREWKEFYTRVSHAVRWYMEAVRPGWGEDLTTTEALSRVHADLGPAEAAALGEILRAADRVKFARHEPAPDEALGLWTAARRWIEAVDAPALRTPVDGMDADVEAAA